MPMIVRPLVVFGAGGVAREIFDLIQVHNHEPAARGEQVRYECIGFVLADEDVSRVADLPSGVILEHELSNSVTSGTTYVVGIGSGFTRKKVVAVAEQSGLQPVTLIHPLAHISPSATVSHQGVVISALASISANVQVGRHVFIDRLVSVGHDTVLADYTSIYPSATLSGEVRVEELATVGTNATVLPRVNIHELATVGAGAVVTKDVDSGITVAGVPARELN